MKKTSAVTLIILSAVTVVLVSAAVRTRHWWQRETAAGRQVSFVSPRAWGFYSLQSETLVAYPPGQPDGNTVSDVHEFGPLQDSSEHPAYQPQIPIQRW